MTNNKLPAYFEKYFEGKFSEVDDSIGELKIHVNDEIKLLHNEIIAFKRQMMAIWIMVIILLLLHIESFGPSFIAGLKKFVGL
jgi:hypothetical protein